jgi:prepilin-type N-terminal cleavage/methylation domain-containing protein
VAQVHQRSNTLLKHIRKHEDKSLLEQGFTLIELLVVVAILGICRTAISAVGNLTTTRRRTPAPPRRRRSRPQPRRSTPRPVAT